MLFMEIKMFLLCSAYCIKIFGVDNEFLLSEMKHTIKLQT